MSSNEAFKIKSNLYESEELLIKKKSKSKRMVNKHNNEEKSHRINTINYLKKSIKLV